MSTSILCISRGGYRQARCGAGANLLGVSSYAYLFTPDIPPFNRKYKGRSQPFFGVDDRIPLLLTLLLGIQHALAMVGGGMCCVTR